MRAFRDIADKNRPAGGLVTQHMYIETSGHLWEVTESRGGGLRMRIADGMSSQISALPEASNTIVLEPKR